MHSSSARDRRPDQSSSKSRPDRQPVAAVQISTAASSNTAGTEDESLKFPQSPKITEQTPAKQPVMSSLFAKPGQGSSSHTKSAKPPGFLVQGAPAPVVLRILKKGEKDPGLAQNQATPGAQHNSSNTFVNKM